MLFDESDEPGESLAVNVVRELDVSPGPLVPRVLLVGALSCRPDGAPEELVPLPNDEEDKEPSEPESSAWAIPVPPASAAASPRVTAPAPSH